MALCGRMPAQRLHWPTMVVVVRPGGSGSDQLGDDGDEHDEREDADRHAPAEARGHRAASGQGSRTIGPVRTRTRGRRWDS